MPMRARLTDALFSRLEAADKARADTAVEVYPSVNAVMVDLFRQGGHQPRYLWAVLHAARLAAHLRVETISVLEFGVATGNGLAALERAALAAGRHYGIAIDVYGFDGGVGLPPPVDARDLPNLFPPGIFRMDPDVVRAKAPRARLMVGLVADTVPQFLASSPAPVAFASFDLDLYSGTRDALALLRHAPPELLLPRVHCYFDDILGFTYAPFNGERLAIAEFETETRRLSPVFGLRHFVARRFRNAPWVEQQFLCHVLDHPRYAEPDGLLRHENTPPGQRAARSAGRPRAPR